MVDTPVADETGAVVPNQVPIGPGDTAGVVGFRRGGAAPHFPVKPGGHGLGIERALIGGPVLGALGGYLHGMDLADVPVPGERAGALERLQRTLPRARLEHAFRFPDDVPDPTRFLDGHPERLLAIHVLAGPRGRPPLPSRHANDPAPRS